MVGQVLTLIAAVDVRWHDAIRDLPRSDRISPGYRWMAAASKPFPEDSWGMRE